MTSSSFSKARLAARQRATRALEAPSQLRSQGTCLLLTPIMPELTGTKDINSTYLAQAICWLAQQTEHRHMNLVPSGYACWTPQEYFKLLPCQCLIPQPALTPHKEHSSRRMCPMGMEQTGPAPGKVDVIHPGDGSTAPRHRIHAHSQASLLAALRQVPHRVLGHRARLGQRLQQRLEDLRRYG